MLDVFKGMALGKKHWACAETNCTMQKAGMNNWCIATYQEKGSGEFPSRNSGEYGEVYEDRAHNQVCYLLDMDIRTD